MKICKKCGQSKSEDNFYKDKRTVDGLYSSCNKCHQRYNNATFGELARLKKQPTVERVASWHFGRIQCRVNNNKSYGHVKIAMTKDEFIEFVRCNWDFYMEMYNNWKDSNFSRLLSPSIDRIDSGIDYTTSNIQFMTCSENCRKAKTFRIKPGRPSRDDIAYREAFLANPLT